MVVGALKQAGSGCYCPENVLVRALVADLVTRDEVVILDMEAGVEHLSRGVVEKVDALLIVTEPSRVGLASAARISGMAAQLGIRRVFLVGNKIRGSEEEEFIRAGAGDLVLIGSIPYFPETASAERRGERASDGLRSAVAAVRDAMDSALEAG